MWPIKEDAGHSFRHFNSDSDRRPMPPKKAQNGKLLKQKSILVFEERFVGEGERIDRC